MAHRSRLAPSPAHDLLIIVRFSASIADLNLDVPNAETTTGAGLKQLIRAKLPLNLINHRLRLIYAGPGHLARSRKTRRRRRRRKEEEDDGEDEAVEEDGDESSSVRQSLLKSKKKGKQPVRDTRPRLYIHCSIGDVALSESDLAAEAAVASTYLLQKRKDESRSALLSTSPDQSPSAQESTTTPAPRGFDRLLAAGFTPAEVTALRSQFLRRDELRDLEDRWMDEGSTVAQAQAGGQVGAGGSGGDDDGGFGPGSPTVIDDMLWGAVMGFFWPIGCVLWLRREDGVWSWRKGMAVFAGLVVNGVFGGFRITH
ncbi:hypothetical protein POX_d06050 [Penicillium oxalicum]|uniref:hypothetical protein n=1 Tax=Penicillium oxalicum TaxID=69781 RepID=UPI0020B8DA57|nr:hypothetical protein POX_d06050 [Penicillium oxalicum]KAI2790533.1 hypothetical protein POX_d06050 [Penicillium oxalicum]